VESRDRCPLSASCEIVDGEGQHLAEVIGFAGGMCLVMPWKRTPGIRYGDAVKPWRKPGIAVGVQMAGRVWMLWARRWMGLPAPLVEMWRSMARCRGDGA